MSDVQGKTTTKDEPCLCAQMCDAFIQMMDGQDTPEIRAALKAEANSECYMCHGEGVDHVPQTDAPELNLCNANAHLLLGTLGLPTEDIGKITLSEARRGLLRAFNRSDLSGFTREQEVLHGAPRAQEDGTVEMRPVRGVSGGLDENALRDRLERFEALIREAGERGATHIHWS